MAVTIFMSKHDYDHEMKNYIKNII